MRSVPILLGLMATCFAQAGQTAPIGGEDRFAELLLQIEEACQFSPELAWPLAGEAATLLADDGDAVRQLRLTIAMAPAKALRRGYQSTREELTGLVAVALEVPEPADLMVCLRMALADLALRYGDLRYGFRQNLAAFEWTSNATPKQLRWKALEQAIHLNLGLGYPQHAREILRSMERAGTLESAEWRPRTHLLQAWIATIANNERLLRASLDSFSNEIGHDLPRPLLANYWTLKAKLALLDGDTDKADNFSMELGNHGPPGISGTGHMLFMRALIAHATGAIETEVVDLLDQSAHAYASAGRPGFFPLALVMLFRWDEYASQGGPGRPFLRELAEFAYRDESSWISVHAFLARSILLEEAGEIEAAMHALRVSNQMSSHIAGVMDELHAEWTERERKLAALEPGSDEDELPLYYVLLLFSLFLIVLLGLALRMRTQQHINEQLEESVRKSRIAEEAAEHASKLKSQFISNISHEIKTPMSGLVGMGSILEEVITDPRHRKYIDTIRTCSRNLLVLMDDLLDLGRMESGRMEVDQVPFNLEETLEYCREMTIRAARSKQLDFRIACADGVPAVLLGDSVRLGQVLINLLNNAIKFTESGSVEALLSYNYTIGRTGNLCIRVVDTGIGIEPGRLNTVFEPFNQYQPEAARRVGGSGLGLAISRKLVELMGGTISVESQVGKGTTFTLEIPFRQAGEPTKPIHDTSTRNSLS